MIVKLNETEKKKITWLFKRAEEIRSENLDFFDKLLREGTGGIRSTQILSLITIIVLLEMDRMVIEK